MQMFSVSNRSGITSLNAVGKYAREGSETRTKQGCCVIQRLAYLMLM